MKLASSSLIPDDPTVLLTIAGMLPFKPIFLGLKESSTPRATSSQKCIRTNDIENVGRTARHHTFFEMLGNFSFGDYFKKEAIQWAWELLTDVYKIDKDSLYVTVFEGAKEDGLEKDNEAFSMWKKHLSEERILNGNKKDNFWEMGKTGPCGPSSEIHFDNRSDQERAKISGADLVNEDHPHVVEIWNLVFIQYNRFSNGKLKLLPNSHVDTGMGLERITAVLQKTSDNYKTDIFNNIIESIAEKLNEKN